MRAAGGTFIAEGDLDGGFMLADGRLITGMDNSSTREVARRVVRVLGR